MKEKLYHLWARFLTWVGDLYLATELPKTKAKQILEMLDIIKEGDVLCRGYNYYFDSKLIPGEFTHSGIVLSKSIMAHSVAEGVGEINPIDFIKDTDRFIILRPKYISKFDISEATNRARWHIQNKTQYDFMFNDPTRYYCHEYTCDCLAAATIRISLTTKKYGVWFFSFEKRIYLAENLIECCEVIYKFDPK